MARRGAWATRFGIYLAAIGSAFGLGGLWRFPYVVSENGGGAFVILYFFLMIFLGMPLLIGELLIGKVTRRGVLSGQRQLVAQAQSRGTIDKRRWLIRIMPLLAGVALFCCVAILGYYSVVSGWVLHFLVQFWSLSVGDAVMSPHAVSMIQLKDSGMLQLFLASMHIVAVSVIVAKGVEDGIEKWVGFVMPIFVIILSVLVVKSLTMSSSGNAIRYLLYPDFSKLNIRSLGAAVGQLCFTLSVGFACMVTFGSYLRDAAIVPSTGFRVATFDSATALIAGFLVFPLVIGGSGELKGPELLFNSVPGFLLKLDGGIVFGIFFFLCLYMAALGASISLFETLVANICENSHLSRGKASLLASLATIISSVVPALSSTVFKDVLAGGHNLFEFIDFVLIDWIVPIVALVFSQIVIYEVNEKMKIDEFAGLEGASRDILYTQWSFLMKWVVPSVIVFALILQFVGLFQH